MHTIKHFLLLIFLLFTYGCSIDDGNVTYIEDNTTNTGHELIQDTYKVNKILVPTLIVIMNWTDYSETDETIWYNKFFNHSTNSVNKWYDETLGGEYELSAVTETSGTVNDGIITVNMGVPHPGNSDATFRDTYISSAIQNLEVVNKMDFTLYDTNNDTILSNKEIQIIFIVAGGETSNGDASATSIWAHAWSYSSASTLRVDGMLVMRTDTNSSKSGKYARFGANHGGHKAAIGIIVHEIGHSLFNLGDYYDDGGGSGLGWYDIMSGGSWARQATDTYNGDTPTFFSAYNKIDAGFDLNVTDVNTATDLTIRCSSREYIKLITSKPNEYFLIECRDTSKANSDISLNFSDNAFTEDKLFMMTYHVDTDKLNNNEDGIQTNLSHYKVALIEKETTSLMTKDALIYAKYYDVYTVGESINTSATFLYDGTATNYSINVLSQDTTNRKMTIRITK